MPTALIAHPSADVYGSDRQLLEAIAAFNRADIPVAVVTNQAGVARGMYGIDDVDRMHRFIAERLAEHGAHIDLFLYCPYHSAGAVAAFARTSEDRKPMPSMAKAAQAALDLDLSAIVNPTLAKPATARATRRSAADRSGRGWRSRELIIGLGEPGVEGR